MPSDRMLLLPSPWGEKTCEGCSLRHLEESRTYDLVPICPLDGSERYNTAERLPECLAAEQSALADAAELAQLRSRVAFEAARANHWEQIHAEQSDELAWLQRVAEAAKAVVQKLGPPQDVDSAALIRLRAALEEK
jgi:hypothetical protein